MSRVHVQVLLASDVLGYSETSLCVLERRSVQVQPEGAQRGAGERGRVQLVRRAQGRQGAHLRQRPRHAEARRQLLHLQLPGPLPGRHEGRRHRRLSPPGRPAAATAAGARRPLSPDFSSCPNLSAATN